MANKWETNYKLESPSSEGTGSPQGYSENDPTGSFQREIADQADNETTGGYKDASGPLDPSKVPPHMRSFITMKEAEPSIDDEQPPLSPPHRQVQLREDERIPSAANEPTLREDEEEFVSFSSSEPHFPDPNEERADNVFGVDVQTGEKMVRPSKPKDNPFAVRNPVSESAYSGQADISAILEHVAASADYQPYELPSRGVLYPRASPLSDGKVLIRPMRGQDEEILLTPSLLLNGEAIEMIMQRCIAFSNRSALKDPLEMLTQDRVAALIVIRGMTYGPDYNCRISCNHCGSTFQSIISLEHDLDVHFLEDPDLREPIRTVLPDSKLEVRYRLSRGFDERELNQHIESQRKRNKGKKERGDSTTFRALQLITDIQGISNKTDMKKILDKITMNDRAHLRDCFNFPPFGVDTRVNIQCPECMRENAMRMPIGVDFFMPQREERA